jgi:hypothetical protein
MACSPTIKRPREPGYSHNRNGLFEFDNIATPTKPPLSGLFQSKFCYQLCYDDYTKRDFLAPICLPCVSICRRCSSFDSP